MGKRSQRIINDMAVNLPCNFSYKLCMGCTRAGKRWNKAENWDTQDTAAQDLIKHEVNTKNPLPPDQEGKKFYQWTVFSFEIAHTLNPGQEEALEVLEAWVNQATDPFFKAVLHLPEDHHQYCSQSKGSSWNEVVTREQLPYDFVSAMVQNGPTFQHWSELDHWDLQAINAKAEWAKTDKW